MLGNISHNSRLKQLGFNSKPKKREEKNAVKIWELAEIKTLHILKVEKIKQIYVKQENYMAKLKKKCHIIFFCR